MEVDNLMVMPDIEEHTDWDEWNDIWSEKEDRAWEDLKEEKFFYGSKI